MARSIITPATSLLDYEDHAAVVTHVRWEECMFY